MVEKARKSRRSRESGRRKKEVQPFLRAEFRAESVVASGSFMHYLLVS